MTSTSRSEASVRDIPHGTPSGYNYHGCRCSVCVEGKRDRDRSYYERTRERKIAQAKAYYEANHEAGKAARRAYGHTNAAAISKRNREKYQANPERYVAKTAAWRKANPEKRKNLARIDTARRRGAPYTPEAKAWIKSLVDPECFYCGQPATCIDHLTPVSKGGTGELSNLVPACRSCNCRKWALDADDFIQRKAG